MLSDKLGLREEFMLLTVAEWHERLRSLDQNFPEGFDFWPAYLRDIELNARSRVRAVLLEFCPHCDPDKKHRLFDATPVRAFPGPQGLSGPRWDCELCGESFTSIPEGLIE